LNFSFEKKKLQKDSAFRAIIAAVLLILIGGCGQSIFLGLIFFCDLKVNHLFILIK